jgi:hypothetical protein
MTRKESKRRIGLAHHLPHRTRYRVSTKHRDDETAGRIRDSIMAVPGVSSVEVNQRTGSVLVHHEERPGILESISSALDRLGEDIFEEVFEGGLDEIVPGASLFGHLIRKHVAQADSKVADLTNNLLDLKMLLPICFFGAGIFKVSRNRNWLDQVPAWVLFYYAYDSYLKFHGPASQHFQPAQPGGNGPVLRLKGATPNMPNE